MRRRPSIAGSGQLVLVFSVDISTCVVSQINLPVECWDVAWDAGACDYHTLPVILRCRATQTCCELSHPVIAVATKYSGLQTIARQLSCLPFIALLNKGQRLCGGYMITGHLSY